MVDLVYIYHGLERKECHSFCHPHPGQDGKVILGLAR